MKFEHTEVNGFANAVIGMRNPMMSHKQSDSIYYPLQNRYVMGPKDLDLAQRLLATGSDSDGKFLRMIHVSTQITAPTYFCAELDTYKVGTTRNSSSLQHKGMSRDYTIDDFTIEDNEEMKSAFQDQILPLINQYRRLYKETNDYKYFRMMRQLIPMSYNYTFMWDANYAVIRNMYRQRVTHPHRLREWTEDFAEWVKTLPYAKELIIE